MIASTSEAPEHKLAYHSYRGDVTVKSVAAVPVSHQDSGIATLASRRAS